MDSFELLALAVVVGIVLFAIFRNFFLWYFKINERAENLEKISSYLWFIAKSQNPLEFEGFEEQMKNSFSKSSLEKDMERVKSKYQ